MSDNRQRLHQLLERLEEDAIDAQTAALHMSDELVDVALEDVRLSMARIEDFLASMVDNREGWD